jgi:hypothetical protein
MEMNGDLHAPAVFFGEITIGTRFVGGSVGPKVVLDAAEKRKISFPIRNKNQNLLYVLRFCLSFLQSLQASAGKST